MAREASRPDAVMAIVPDWIERHCVVPDGFLLGKLFHLYDWQFTFVSAMYTVRGTVEYDSGRPVLGHAFRYQRGLMVGPQKLGKDPMGAAIICAEGAGPVLFAGWATKDEGYSCRDHGCSCGWEYPYEPGEPMGMGWPTPLIQITAVSEDQTDNAYDALRPMIDLGPLHDLIPKTGEDFIRLPSGGRIETVTSSAPSRLGQRITHAKQGEAGLYTVRNGMTKVADTQYRNLAGMDGRATLDTNAWDPSQHSVAQREFELVEKKQTDDIYIQYIEPPANLSYANKAERRKIHRIVYGPEVRRENGGHIELDSIEAEAAKMVVNDPAQAARFFGNKRESGAGRAFDLEVWAARAAKASFVVPRGTLCTIGFDGSKRWDHSSMIGTVVETGYQWPIGIWRPEDYPRHEIPAELVTNVLAEAMDWLDVWRLYADPPYWEDTIAGWAGRWGDQVVLEWWTNRYKQMAYAYRSWKEAQATGAMSHCATTDKLCALFTNHVGNAYRLEIGSRDELGPLWIVQKERDGSPEKVDSCPAAALSWEARNDALAAGAANIEAFVSVYETRGVVGIGAPA